MNVSPSSTSDDTIANGVSVAEPRQFYPERRTAEQVEKSLPIEKSKDKDDDDPEHHLDEDKEGLRDGHDNRSRNRDVDNNMDIYIQKMNRFYTLAEEYLARRNVEIKARHKCPHCWFTLPKNMQQTDTTNHNGDTNQGSCDKTSSGVMEGDNDTKKARKVNKPHHHAKTQHCICHKLVKKLSKYNTKYRLSSTQQQNNNKNYHPPIISLTSNIRVIIYMHYLEWMNGGNSGKLLLKCLNANRGVGKYDIVQLFLYGRRDHDEKLRHLLQTVQPNRTALLFPSSDAIDLEYFLKESLSHYNDNNRSSRRNHEKDECFETPSKSTEVMSESPITLVVIDATYKKAKNIVKHFQKRINMIVTNDDDFCSDNASRRIPTVKLNIDALINSSINSNSNDNEKNKANSSAPISSIFARAQKKYGKKNVLKNSSLAQSSCDSSANASASREIGTNHGRVCTVEAVAYALQICGESQNTVDALLDAVRVNNDAAKYYL